MIWVLAFILMSGILSFAAGILLPLLALEKLYVFTETPSLIQIVIELWSGGDQILALLIAVFSLIFPLIKFFVLTVEGLTLYATTPASKKTQTLKHVTMLSRWSMMDVLLVALVIFAAKTSGLAEAFTQPGLWFYFYAVLASAMAASLLKRLGTSKFIKGATTT